VDQVLDQKLALVKLVALHQRCTGEKPAQHKNKDSLMLIPYNQFFTLFVISYVLVGVLTPLMRKIAVSKKIFDKPI
jgi:hypothetical protein